MTHTAKQYAEWCATAVRDRDEYLAWADEAKAQGRHNRYEQYTLYAKQRDGDARLYERLWNDAKAREATQEAA